MTLRTLLAAIDPDGNASDIVDIAADMAQAFGASLVVLHVVPLPASVDADALRNPQAHPATQQVLREREQAVLPTLQTIVQRALERGCSATSLRLGHGDPADTILGVADALSADMLVVGTHGRKNPLRGLLGSVAESVIRAARVPVLTVRHRADAPSASFIHREIPLP